MASSEKRKEVLDGGRLLGVISRTDPEVYDVIRTLSEENGENPINVMVNIIKKYLMVQKIEQSKLSLEQILAAFELFKDIARESIRMYIDLAGLVFSDVSTAFGEIIEKKAQQLSKTENSVDREIKRRIYEEIFKAYQPMMNMVSVMMSSMMSNMMKNTMNVQGVNVNTQSAGNEKKDIPVNINIGT
jgi:hypothetical protein